MAALLLGGARCALICIAIRSFAGKTTDFDRKTSAATFNHCKAENEGQVSVLPQHTKA